MKKSPLEQNETLVECAIRETEEETLRTNQLLTDKEIYIDKYITPTGENVENYMYIAIDDGPTTKEIREEDREIVEWYSFDEVENKLSYESLKKFWAFVKGAVYEMFESN